MWPLGPKQCRLLCGTSIFFPPGTCSWVHRLWRGSNHATTSKKKEFQQEHHWTSNLLSNNITSWWFQPIWKILYSQIGHLPQVGVKIKNVWNHQPDYDDKYLFILSIKPSKLVELRTSCKPVRMDCTWPRDCVFDHTGGSEQKGDAYLTPPKTNMEPEKYPLGKGETTTNHQFLGSMLNFRGVYLFISETYLDRNIMPNRCDSIRGKGISDIPGSLALFSMHSDKRNHLKYY